MAVGAGTGRIVVLVVGESLRRVMPGLVLGCGLAMLAVPWVRAFVSGGRGSPDALLVGGAIAGMLLIGVAAAVQPAARAARLDPNIVLRAD